jgi:hypothetical protein
MQSSFPRTALFIAVVGFVAVVVHWRLAPTPLTSAWRQYRLRRTLYLVASAAGGLSFVTLGAIANRLISPARGWCLAIALVPIPLAGWSGGRTAARSQSLSRNNGALLVQLGG